MAIDTATMIRLRHYWLETLLVASCAALVMQLGWSSLASWLQRPRAGAQVFQASASYAYLLYLPQEYDAEKQWPLLLYLHGSGSRGDGLDPDRMGGPPQLVRHGRHFDMIVVSPQCPLGANWRPEQLTALLDEVESRFRPSRTMVTGFSMGGAGTWDLALHSPARFAAIAPLCGCGHATDSKLLKDIPIWCFHGEQDDVVPVQCSQEMISSVRAAGGMPRLTIYCDRGHNISSLVYNGDELFQWLLSPHAADDRLAATGHYKGEMAP